jgi:SagB-type dehydrogenase family enzyme
MPKKQAEKTPITRAAFFGKESSPLVDLVSFCGNLPMPVYADTVGVKSPEVTFKGARLSQNRFISVEYLLNYRRSEADMGSMLRGQNDRQAMVMGAPGLKQLKTEADKLIPLPAPKQVEAPLDAVLCSYRSIYHYSGKSMTLPDLATILFYAQGISGQAPLQNMPETVSLGPRDVIELRTASSGGGLYPIELFLIALNIETLAQGIYAYTPSHHALRLVKIFPENFDLAQLGQLAEIEVAKASLLLVYSYKLFENSQQYGNSDLADAFIEAGAISEHVHLICTALGIGPCDVGRYAKHHLEDTLGLDGLSQHVIHLTIIGM